MKPEAPKSMQRRMMAGSSLADTTTTGTLGILRAQVHQPGESAHARHGEIEQDEIDVAAALEQLRPTSSNDAGLGDLDAFEQAGHGLAQRAAKQRMVVGNDQTIAGRSLRSSPDRSRASRTIAQPETMCYDHLDRYDPTMH